jgi:hypothetical protein
MKYLIIPLLILVSLDCLAQNTNTKNDTTKNIFERLGDHGFEIRRAFDGTKNESKSALLQYVKDFQSDSNSTSSIDLAIKIIEIEVQKHRLYFYPILEWHRKVLDEDLDNEDSYNKVSASLNTEWGVLSTKFTPIIIGSASIKNDFKDDDLEGEFRVETTFKKTGSGWLPGANINDKHGNTILKYYPYVGYEHYTGLIEGIDNIEFLKSRLYVELYPFGTDNIKGIFEYAKRWSTDDQVFNSDPEIITSSLNYDLNDYFSITIEYENGNLPVNDFEKSHTLKLGLGFKI